MKKLVAGLALALCAAASHAQSTITFYVKFNQVYEASGAFAPNLVPVAAGPFCTPPACTIPPVFLTGKVELTAVASGTQLTSAGGTKPNQITLWGNFSTQSGNSPSNGWSVHTFKNAVFNLLKPSPAPNSYFATDFVGAEPGQPNDWPIFIGTSADGVLSDHGPVAAYGGTCPYFFGCASAEPAGQPGGTGAYSLYPSGTPIYDTVNSVPFYPATVTNAGNYPLVSGAVSQTNPSTGLGFDNGIDAFAFQGVLDTANVQALFSTSLPFPDGYVHGANTYPGKVRILTFSSTGNTAYMIEGNIVAYGPDTDADGLPDGIDNCTLVANPTQLDADGDGYGNICDADLNNSGTVTAGDFTLLKSVLNKASTFSPLAAAADMNGSGTVTASDFTILKSYLNKPPGPSGLH